MEDIKPKRQYKNGHCGHDKFRAAIAIAREAYYQIKRSTTLEQWRTALSEEDEIPITWKEIWTHVVSLSLLGMIEVTQKVIRGGFLKLQVVGHENIYHMVASN